MTKLRIRNLLEDDNFDVRISGEAVSIIIFQSFAFWLGCPKF